MQCLFMWLFYLVLVNGHVVVNGVSVLIVILISTDYGNS